MKYGDNHSGVEGMFHDNLFRVVKLFGSMSEANNRAAEEGAKVTKNTAKAAGNAAMKL